MTADERHPEDQQDLPEEEAGRLDAEDGSGGETDDTSLTHLAPAVGPHASDPSDPSQASEAASSEEPEEPFDDTWACSVPDVEQTQVFPVEGVQVPGAPDDGAPEPGPAIVGPDGAGLTEDALDDSASVYREPTLVLDLEQIAPVDGEALAEAMGGEPDGTPEGEDLSSSVPSLGASSEDAELPGPEPGPSLSDTAVGEVGLVRSLEGSEEGAGEDEDVFVILPDQADGEIPVVSTETFDDGAGEQLDGPGALGEIDLTEMIGDDPELTEGSDLTELVVDDYGDPTEIVDDDELDELTSSLDDEDVLGHAELTGELGDGDLVWDSDGFEEGAPTASTSGRGWTRVLLPLAASLVVAAGAWQVWGPGFFPTGAERTADAASAGAGVATTPTSPADDASGAGPQDGDLLTDVDVGTSLVDPASGAGVGGREGDPARQEVRTQVLLALRLGLVGEVAQDD